MRIQNTLQPHNRSQNWSPYQKVQVYSTGSTFIISPFKAFQVNEAEKQGYLYCL